MPSWQYQLAALGSLWGLLACWGCRQRCCEPGNCTFERCCVLQDIEPFLKVVLPAIAIILEFSLSGTRWAVPNLATQQLDIRGVCSEPQTVSVLADHPLAANSSAHIHNHTSSRAS